MKDKRRRFGKPTQGWPLGRRVRGRQRAQEMKTAVWKALEDPDKGIAYDSENLTYHHVRSSQRKNYSPRTR